MRILLAVLLLGGATASAKEKIPLVIKLKVGGKALPLVAQDVPKIPKRTLIIMDSEAIDLRDSLNALPREKGLVWRCTSHYFDLEAISHYVKGGRSPKLMPAARSAMSHCRWAAGKARAKTCRIVKLGCRLGKPRVSN